MIRHAHLDRGHAGEILHQDARGLEHDLVMVATMLELGRELFDISDGNGCLSTVIVSQQIFDSNLESEGKAGHVPNVAGRLERAEIFV